MVSAEHQIFSHLEQFSQAQVALNNAYLSKPELKLIKQTALTCLNSLLDNDSQISLKSAHPLSKKEAEISKETHCRITLSQGLQQNEICILVSHSCARFMVSRLLGIKDLNYARPLSEIECGVFNYLTLKVLHQLNQAAALAEKLYLQSIDRDFIWDASCFPAQSLCASFRLIGEDKSSIIHVLAHSLSLAKLASSQVENAATLRLEGFSYQIRVELCSLDIARSDVESLELGDVIIFNNSSLRWKKKRQQLNGIVKCQLSDSTYFEAQLLTNPQKQLLLQISSSAKTKETIMNQDLPDHALDELPSLSENTQSEPLTEKVVSPALLSALPVSVSIEIGRLALDIASVSQFHVGQMLELNRSVDEAIDIVIAGKKNWSRRAHQN